MSDHLRIGFTGDVMLGRLVDRWQRERGVRAVWGDVLERLTALDGLFINLECCLSTRGEEWRRTYRPFHFRADPKWAIPALERAGVDWVSLANNHVLDYGETALVDTLEHLEAAAIPYAGAGRTRRGAWRPSTVTIGDVTVGLVAFTDNTPEYAAGVTTPGTAYARIDVDDSETVDAVQNALSSLSTHEPDLVVASLHWGPNMVTEPPRSFRRFAHWLVDQGVDVIHGHSAHVFQGIERYEGRPICYDTGDFVDDYAVDPRLRNDRGFLFELVVDSSSGRLESLELTPVEIYDGAVHEASEEAAVWCRNRIKELSAPFDTPLEFSADQVVIPLG
ncbi:MAG: CapA family protein [Halobacteriota archaeon]